MAPLLEPTQRPRPTRPVPPGHAPTGPGPGGLYRQEAPHHRHGTPGGGLCHHAPGNRDRHLGAGDARGRGFRDKGYTPFLSRWLAETEATSTSRGGDLLTAVSSKYVAEHEVLSFTEIVPRKAAALEIRTDGGGLTLINVRGPQAGRSPWAGRAAFWADIQMYATARSLGGIHPVVIAGNTNVYMDATTNPATEHFWAGWEACGFRRATAGGAEDMTPTLHPSDARAWVCSLALSLGAGSIAAELPVLDGTREVFIENPSRFQIHDDSQNRQVLLFQNFSLELLPNSLATRRRHVIVLAFRHCFDKQF